MVKVEALEVVAGAFHLGPLNLQLKAGECHALLGPSGSGKSTFVSTLLGLRDFQSGTIVVDGHDMSGVPVHQRRFGYVPQHLALFPHMDVAANIRYGIEACHLPASRTQPLLEELIETTGIAPLLHRMPSTLSGGERQRVALVRALATQPRLLLLDEPFSALDTSLRRDLWLMVKGLQEEYGTTTLLITHDLQEAYFLASRISVIIDGTIRQSGSRESVYFHPKSTEVARYLGMRNLFNAKVLSRQPEYLLVEVPQLGTKLKIPDAPLKVGSGCTLAIRKEQIRPCDPKAQENILTGTLEMFPLGEGTLLYLKPEGASQNLEIFTTHTDPDILQRYRHVHLPSSKIILLSGD